VSGLALWAKAGPNTRELFIRLACDGDNHVVETRPDRPSVRRRLTIAQALEVLK